MSAKRAAVHYNKVLPAMSKATASILPCLMPSQLSPTTDVAFWRKPYRLRSRWARNALLDFASKPTAACAIGHFVEMLCTTGSQVSCSLAMKANASSGVMARV